MSSAAVAFLTAALVSVVVGPWVIRLLTSLGVRQTVSKDVPERHRGKQGTPTMGGIIILLGAAVGASVVWIGDHRVVAIVVMTLAFAALGFLDDYLIASRGKSLGLKARHKLLAQFIIAIGFVLWVHADRTAFPTVSHLWGYASIDLGWLYYPFAVLLIVGMSNAVNLADGLDGLVAGLTAIVCLALGMIVLGALGVDASLSILAWAFAGACLGFLWHNSNPAKVFMGDTGSLALGAAMAAIAIVARREFVFLMVAAVFVVEALSVIIQVISFKTTGKRVFRMTPIHHHFELVGWPEQKIVTRFWIVQGLIAVAVLAGIGVFGQ